MTVKVLVDGQEKTVTDSVEIGLVAFAQLLEKTMGEVDTEKTVTNTVELQVFEADGSGKFVKFTRESGDIAKPETKNKEKESENG